MCIASRDLSFYLFAEHRGCQDPFCYVPRAYCGVYTRDMGANRCFPLLLVVFLSSITRLAAQEPCANTPAYTPCEFTFDLSDADAAAHPNPYLTVRLQIEFRSPRFRTYLMPAFWDGGRRMVVRFTPTEGGEWTYRITSNIAALENETGHVPRRRVRGAGLHPPRQRPPLGMDGEQPAAPVDGGHLLLLRHHRRGSFPSPGRHPRATEVQPPARHGVSRGGRRQGVSHAGPCQPGILPRPGCARSLPELQGHCGGPDPGRRPQPACHAIPRVAAARTLRALPGGPLRAHEHHLAGRAGVRGIHRRPRFTQRDRHPAEANGPV